MRMLAGRWTVEFLSELNFAVAFVSAAGVSLDQGLTTARRPLADVDQRRAGERRAQHRPDRRDEVRPLVAAGHRARAGARCDSHRRRAAGRGRGGVPGRRRAARDRQPPAGESMSRPVTLFTGQWADLPLADLAAKTRRVGLRRARAGLLGRPLRRRARGARPRLRRRAAQAARAARARRVGDRQPPRRPGRVRPDRRPPPGRARRRGVGRRRSRGRAAARRRADEGHGARRRAARRRGRHRLHRLADLAPPLLVPAERLLRRRGRLPGVRRALGADHRRVRRRGRASSRSRSTRPRSPTTSSRRARRSTRSATATGFGINFDPTHFEHQFLDSAAFITEFGDRDLPRAHQGLQAPARRAHARSSAGTSTSASPAAAGTSSRPGTATSTSRR